MGSSHSSPENISLNTNTNLQKELVSKCEEFSAQNNSRVWKGLSHALQKVTLSNEALENLSSLVQLSDRDHDALLLIESFIFETNSSNDCKRDDVRKLDISITKSLNNSDATAKEIMAQTQEENSIPLKNDPGHVALQSTDAVEDKTNSSLKNEQCIHKESRKKDSSQDNNSASCEDNFQFIIVNGNDETEEKEQTKWIERKKSDIRKKNGKLMPPLSSQSPRTLHASPSISLAIKN